MAPGYCNEVRRSDGLSERVQAYMRAYQFNLDDIAALLHSDPQLIADWFIGAAPRPERVHTLLFSAGTPPNARGPAWPRTKPSNHLPSWYRRS